MGSEIFQLKTVNIDTEKGIVNINGHDVGDATLLNISFENGAWSIVVHKNLLFNLGQTLAEK